MMKIKNGIVIAFTVMMITGCSMVSPYVKKAPVPDRGQNERNMDNDSSQRPGSVDFNQIKVINGKKVIQNPSNILVLVNKEYLLPSNYIPEDLVRPNVSFSYGDVSLEKSLLRKKAALALEKMFSEAKGYGLDLYAASGYRSYSRQKNLFDAEVNRVGESMALKAVAEPGTSEHQSGLAVDICSKSTNLKLAKGFAKSAEGKWLEKNAHRFGYILRYPEGKEGITHYEYEPWHYRYVGIKTATIIYKHNWTLEEYVNKGKKR